MRTGRQALAWELIRDPPIERTPRHSSFRYGDVDLLVGSGQLVRRDPVVH
jgi:hypothetical protein